jgi:mRNA interferase MazF
MVIDQYNIVLVNLDPTVGSEIKKTRPCLVISPNEINQNLRTIIIAPMTTKSRNYPSRVSVKHNQKKGWIVLDQIRTIDKTRVIKTLGKISAKEILETKAIIKEMLID